MRLLNNILKRRLLLLVTLLCLLGLVSLQILGIFRSARMQELQFKHSVDLAMQSFLDNMEKDKEMYVILKKCNQTNETYKKINKSYLSSLSRKEVHRVDSLIRNDLKLFGIDLDFKFDLVDYPAGGDFYGGKGVFRDAYYFHDINKSVNASGLSLLVEFPGKRAFLAAQIGPEFISSLLLILFMFVAFFLVYRFYKKEQQISANMKDFINNMTHELKTPLASIAFSNNLILKQPDIEKGKLKKYSGIISEETKKLTSQVEELLHLAKLNETDTGKNYEPIVPNQLVTEAHENLKTIIEEKDASIYLELCPDCGIIQGHKLHLINSISNLIENALKYSINKPIINIKSFIKNDQFVLKVIDNGIGIAKENLNYIFDKFYRVSTNDRHDVKGFGLGLFYVKSVILNHKGEVEVESKPGVGSEFTISIPLAGS